MKSTAAQSYLTRSETWFINAEIEDASAEVLGPEGFPLWSSFSSGGAILGPLTCTGAEFSTVTAQDTQSKVIYGYC